MERDYKDVVSYSNVKAKAVRLYNFPRPYSDAAEHAWNSCLNDRIQCVFSGRFPQITASVSISNSTGVVDNREAGV